MKAKKRIGLLLALGTNYGALLQSYATQRVLDVLGYDTFIIVYSGSRLDSFRNGIRGIVYCITSHLKKNGYRKPKQNLDVLHQDNRNKRTAVQQVFIKKRFNNVLKISSYSRLVEFAHSLDAVIIGSDQSWLPPAMFSVKGSLSFVPKDVRRISYATSLGVSEYPKLFWRQARKVWKRMDFISVREEQGRDIILRICGDITVQVVCDPTYLFTEVEWERLIPVERLEEEKYVLCYFLGTDKALFDIARRFAKKKDLKLLSILTCEVAVEGDDTFPDRLIIGASPEDFVNYVRGAEYILTDSFHGTAFSVINEKQFYLFYPQRNYLALSRNSRLDNIVKMWGIEDRLILDKKIDWDQYNFTQIDYEDVTPRVFAKRQESLDYLKKALDFND